MNNISYHRHDRCKKWLRIKFVMLTESLCVTMIKIVVIKQLRSLNLMTQELMITFYSSNDRSIINGLEILAADVHEVNSGVTSVKNDVQNMQKGIVPKSIIASGTFWHTLFF